MTEFEKITSHVLSLPNKRRAELAEILIQSLDEMETNKVRATWLLEIKRRDEEIRSGKAQLKPADQVIREAREQLRCLK
jgi:hypothetical protein